MRNYLLYSLLDLGLSKNIIGTFDSLSESLFDLIILNKKEELFSQSGRKSSLNKILESLKYKQKWVEEDYLSNHYTLVGFGGSYTTIRDLHTKMELETPVDLIKLNNNEVQQILKRDYTNRLKKIRDNFIKMDNWYVDNKYFILSEFILIQLLIHKKIDILTLKILFQSNLRINKITLKYTMEEIKTALNNLEANSYIIFFNGYYYIADNIYFKSLYISQKPDEVNEVNKLRSIHDVIIADSTDMEVLEWRLNGFSLQEIGKEMGVTRERIRQRQNKALKKLGKIYEVEKYKEVYEKYDISLEAFIRLYEEEEIVYNLLKLVLKKGKKDFFEYILDNQEFSDKVKLDLLLDKNYYLNRNGEIVKLLERNLFDDILYKYKEKTFLPEEFLEYYLQEIKNYNLDIEDRTESRFLEGFTERSSYAISTFGRKFRYYDLDIEEEYIESIREIVKEYEEGAYSTLKLFNENTELMKSLDINDEYELHNLIKKCDIQIEGVSIERSPGFIKGDIDKKEFYKKELLSFSGDLIDNFVEYLYEEFGLKQETMKAYISNNFREYIDGDKIVSVYEASPEKINALKPKLDKIFYRKVEIIKLLKEHNLDYNSYILSKLGYHIYKNLVYKNKYVNGYRAFLEYIINDEEFRLDTIELHRQPEFMHFIYRAEMNRELVSISKGVYLTRGFLGESGLQREMIDTFVNNVYSFVASKKYFSYRQLLDEGFTDELIDHGFDDYFYERLLTSSDKFFAVTRNTPVIFIDEKEDKRDIASFIEYELLNNESGISIIDFKEYLMTKYHTDFEIDRLIGIIKRGTCFYSNKLGKVFHNSDDFLKKIYP